MKRLNFTKDLYCSLVIFILLNATTAELEETKNRRNVNGGGTSGLYAFPRVGRSDSNLNNQLHNVVNDNTVAAIDLAYPANTYDEYEDYSKSNKKRANLVAFPRVGRTINKIRKWAHLMALEQALDRRAGPSAATTGVWFGPRLGKRNVDYINENNTED